MGPLCPLTAFDWGFGIFGAALRQDEKSSNEIEQTNAGGNPSGRCFAKKMITEPSNEWAKDKAETKTHADDHADPAGALFGRRDISHIG